VSAAGSTTLPLDRLQVNFTVCVLLTRLKEEGDPRDSGLDWKTHEIDDSEMILPTLGWGVGAGLDLADREAARSSAPISAQ